MRAGTGQPSLPTATAVSDMRLENPHSLSYHDSTRTSRPSMTWVCVRSKVELAGLWLKSIDASGLRSEEHTSELQSLMRSSYAVFCLKKKKHKLYTPTSTNT